jgi:CHAT domain-containing protein
VNIEIAFVISVWVVAFLICLASGIPLVVTIFVSSAMAYGLRKLWLRRFIFFNEALLTGLIALLVALLIITDRFGIGSSLWYIAWSAQSVFVRIGLVGGLLSRALIPEIAVIAGILFFLGERRYLKLRYGASAFTAILIASIGPVIFLGLLATTAFLFYETFLTFAEHQGTLGFAIFASVIDLVSLFACGFVGCYSYSERPILIGRIRFAKALKLSARLSHEIARNEGRGSFSESRQAIAQAMKPLQDVSGHFLLKSSLWETVGKIDLALTDFSSAKRNFDAALQAHDQIEEGDPVRRLALLENIGALSLRLGDWTVASDTLSEVATAKRAQLGSNHPDLAAALVKLGMVHQMLGRYSDAKRDLDAALTIQRRVLPNDSVEIATTLRILGLVAMNAGDAQTARAHFEGALAIERRAVGDNHPDVGFSLLGLSGAKQALGAGAEARACLEEALRISLLENGVGLRDAVYHALSREQARQGRVPSAIYFGKQAVNAIQNQRGGLTSLGQKLQDSFVTSKEDVYRDLADLLVQAGRLAEAQQVVDLLKAEELSQFTLRKNAPNRRLILLQLTAREVTWTRHGDDIASDLASLIREEQDLIIRSPRSKEDDARLEALRKLLVGANNRFRSWLDDLVDELAVEPPERTEATGALNFRLLGSLQTYLATLGSDVVLVHYLVGRERLAIILTTPDLQVSRSVAIGETDLNALVHRFREAIRVGSRDTTDLLRLAKALHRHMIEPIGEYLVEAKVVMVVLDGALRYLPLAALHDGQDFLVNRYAFVMLTPASYLSLKDAPRNWDETGVVGLGVSRAAGHEVLNAVQDELQAIIRQDGENEGIYPGKRYLDADFTVAALGDAFATQKVIHIASHFTFGTNREGDPIAGATAASSRLLLGDGVEVSLEDLRTRRFKFGDIDLVTLSACETALGSETESPIGSRGPDGLRQMNGREFESLGVVIQERGVKAVIATLWAVEDFSTASLMERFYRNRRSGLSKALALKEAQISLLKGQVVSGDRGTNKTGATYAHPNFWAPFILMGNWH